MPAVAAALQRLVLRTERGALRPLWALAYETLLRAYALLLMGGEPGATAYARGSLGRGRPVFGLSDVDVAIVVPPDPGIRGLARRRVRDRRKRLCRRLPWLCEGILDPATVFEPRDLEDAVRAPVLTHGLGRGADSEPNDLGPGADHDASARATYFGGLSDRDKIGLQEKPGLYGSVSTWRRVTGPERRPKEPVRDRQLERIAAWLELQSWWRWFLQTSSRPPGPRTADLCVKMVAEPVRIWLWLRHGERIDGRRETLDRALRLLPEEETALRRALELERSLWHSPDSPTGEFTRYAVRFSERLAALMVREVAPAGEVPVRLTWGGTDELLLAQGTRHRLKATLGEASAPLLPLADWRALARSSMPSWPAEVRVPPPPDETLAPVELDPGDADELGRAVRGGATGPYPALRRGELLVLASSTWPRTQLRAAQCPPTDPASFALLDGREAAGYPDVRGWRPRDIAARAVAEHRAWLCHPGDASLNRDALGMLITAARCALFQDSVVQGEPELPLTVAATFRTLRARSAAPAGVIDDCEEAYRRLRLHDLSPAARMVAGMRQVVMSLPAYRDL